MGLQIQRSCIHRFRFRCRRSVIIFLVSMYLFVSTFYKWNKETNKQKIHLNSHQRNSFPQTFMVLCIESKLNILKIWTTKQRKMNWKLKVGNHWNAKLDYFRCIVHVPYIFTNSNVKKICVIHISHLHRVLLSPCLINFF